MTNCCPEPTLTPIESLDPNYRRACIFCQGKSHIVSRRTMLLMLKPELFDKVDDQEYRFCGSPGCRVVYFSDDRHFTVSDVRIRIGVKATSGYIPLCYCFGYSEQDMRDQIMTLGQTSIPQTIGSLCRERACACVERNPAGVCCLGEVMETARRLSLELGWPGCAPSIVK